MRTREEIEDETAKRLANQVPKDKGLNRVMVELLLDIRELLTKSGGA